MSEHVWEGAIWSVMGCSEKQPFQHDHRVPGRATWSRREVSRVLRVLRVRLCVGGKEPVIMGIAETIARRRGHQMAARGVFRDPVRSSKALGVQTNGLRWMSLLLLTSSPWAQRVWAWPFVTVRAPSERSHAERTKRHQTITDGAWLRLWHVSRGLPGRTRVVVGDGTSAVCDVLLNVCRRLHGVGVVTRWRLDACVSDPPPAGREAGKRDPHPRKGTKQPTLAARLTDPMTPWDTHTRSWSGGTTRAMEIATGTALW
ncbi:MAG TPA: hypothetical protein VGF67_28960 [Ktedonobacteraceae bacterium]